VFLRIASLCIAVCAAISAALPASSEDVKPQLPENMASLERVTVIGPGDSALILHKVEGKWTVAGEMGGGVYHLMGQGKSLSEYKTYMDYGLTDEDIKAVYARNREESLKYEKEHPRPKPQKEEPEEGVEEGDWRTVNVPVNELWKEKLTAATTVARENISTPTDAKVEQSRTELLKLYSENKLSAREKAACAANAAVILYHQGKFRDAKDLLSKALDLTQGKKNEESNDIFRVDSKVVSNFWKAARAAKRNAPEEKKLATTWVLEKDVSTCQRFFPKKKRTK